MLTLLTYINTIICKNALVFLGLQTKKIQKHQPHKGNFSISGWYCLVFIPEKRSTTHCLLTIKGKYLFESSQSFYTSVNTIERKRGQQRAAQNTIERKRGQWRAAQTAHWSSVESRRYCTVGCYLLNFIYLKKF